MATAPQTGGNMVLSNKIVGIICAVVTAGITALVTFTYRTSNDISAMTVQISQLSAQIQKLETKIEVMSENYTSKTQFNQLEERVRQVEQKQAEMNARQRR